MKRVLSWLILLLLVLAMALQLALGWLLDSQAGARWLAQQLIARAPLTIRAEGIQGSLRDGLKISALSVTLDDDTAVQASDLALRLRLDALWYGWLEFEHLSLGTLSIALPAAEAGGAPLALDLTLPLGIGIDQLDIAELDIRRAGEPLLAIPAPRLSARRLALRQTLELTGLQLQSGPHQLTANGRIALADPHASSLRFHWQADPATLPGLANRVALADKPHPDDKQSLSGEGQLRGDRQQLTLNHQLHSPLRIDSTLRWQPQADRLSLVSEHQWPAQALPAALLHPQQPPLALSAGQLSAKLDGNQHQLTLGTEISGERLPATAVTLSADGTLDRTALRLTLAQAARSSTLTGTLAQRDQWYFDGLFDGRGLDPSWFIPGWPGQLQVEAMLRASWHPGDEDNASGWQLALDQFDIQGSVREQPLRLNGAAETDGQRLSSRGELHYADSELHWQGRTHPAAHDWQFKLALGPASALHPRWQGSLNGELTLRGRPGDERLDVQLQGEQLRFADWHAATLSLEADGLSRQTLPQTLTLHARDARFQDQWLANALDASWQDNGDQQQLDWQLQHSLGDSQGQLIGRWLLPLDQLERITHAVTPLWRGELRQLMLQPQASLLSGPAWQLRQPLSLVVDSDRLHVTDACLDSAGAQLCLVDNQAHAGQQLALSLSGLPLSRLAALQPLALRTGTPLTGSLHSELTLPWPPGARWQAQLRGGIDALRWQPPQPTLPPLAGEARWQADIADDKLALSAALELGDHGNARMIFDSRLDAVDSPLSGQLALDLPRLDWLAPLLPGVQQPHGQASGLLQLSGNRRQPQFSGALRLQQGSAQLADAGISLEQIDIMLSGDQQQLTLSGSLRAGTGEARVTGHWQPLAGAPGRLHATLEGERLTLLALPEAILRASPSLQLDYADRLLRLRGDIRVDHARLAPRQLPPQAVRPSADEVLIEGDGAPSITPLLRRDLRIRVALGDDAEFRGFGLDTGLAGNLELIEPAGKPLRLQGDLRLRNGRYRAYGQNLAIERGLLLFQDRLDDPGLDIRAVRRIPSQQLLVGVLIGGTLQQPRPTLFSEPAMEDSQAMAYLLTGQSLDRGAANDNAAIAQALMLYGLDTGSGLTERLGERIGVDEIRLGSDWENDDAALLLGKQINDRLYLRYSVGLMDALSAVMLRYTLSRRVHLEATSDAQQQSLDLIYQLERHSRRQRTNDATTQDSAPQ